MEYITRRLVRQTQRELELQKSIMYHMKGLEEGYPMVKISKTVTETLTIKNPKTVRKTLKNSEN